MQILKEEEQDAKLSDRCEAKRKEWAKHWQCDEEILNMKNKSWRNDSLKEGDEALPRWKEGDLDKASRLYKAKTGVGCDGGLGLGDALQLPKEDIAGAERFVRAPEASAVRRLRGGAGPDHLGHLARVQVELFAFTHCSAGCVERSHKHLPVFEAEGFCDDMTALVKGRF